MTAQFGSEAADVCPQHCELRTFTCPTSFRRAVRQDRRLFTDESAHQYVCHYTSSETFLTHVLPTMRLRMSKFATVNDPREAREWTCTLMVPDSLMDREWDIVGLSARFTSYMKATAKLLCVTRDDPDLDPNRSNHLYGRSYAHPSMWDRYGRGHGGVALLLDVGKLATAVALASDGRGDLYRQGVSYEDQPPSENDAYTLWARELVDAGETKAFAEHQRKHHGALYFWKSKDWGPEFEYRWVLLDSSDDDVFIDISDALSGVIFGDAFPPHAVPMVANLLSGRDVTLARIHYRNGHPIVLPQDASGPRNEMPSNTNT